MHLKRHYLQQVLTKENSDDGGDEDDESNDYEFSDDIQILNLIHTFLFFILFLPDVIKYMNIIKYTCATSFTSFIVHHYDHLPLETFSNQLIAIQMQKKRYSRTSLFIQGVV